MYLFPLKFVNPLDLDELLSNPYILLCECANSPGVDKYHNRKITGNVRIINNSSLRNIFCTGSIYKKYIQINWLSQLNLAF